MIAKTININEDERYRVWSPEEEKRTRSNLIMGSGIARSVTGTPPDSYKSAMPKLPKERKLKEKYLTKREYESILKGAIKDLKNNSGLEIENENEFDYYSLVDDMADSMIYDQDLYNYLYRKYQRYYDTYSNPKRSELKEILVNDLTSF